MRLDGPQLRRRQPAPRADRLARDRHRAVARRGAVYIALATTALLLALAFDVAVLYLTLGFRQFSHYFTDIRDALERGDEDRARRLLAEWRHLDASELPRTELLRHVIEHSLLAAHRHVFGVFFWFVVLSALGLGPAGAVLYRMAEFAQPLLGLQQHARSTRRSTRPDGAVAAPVQRSSTTCPRGSPPSASPWSATSRRRSPAGGATPALWQHANEGIILAAAAGAVGVQLGGSAAPGVTPDRSKTFTSGAAPRGRGRRLDPRRAAAARPPAQHRRPGVALGGAVDAAGGAADAGQPAGLNAGQARGQ